MKTTFRFLLAATIAVYLLIFIGGLVRVSGAGLGCPDWPLCFGRLIPPVSVNQLPADIDPAKFNFTLAWIEYGNRLCGAATGILLVIATTLVIVNYRKYPRVFWSTILGFLLLLYTAWQGSQVVESELDSSIVSIHMWFAFLIANILTYATYWAYNFANPDHEKESFYPRGLSIWIALTWGFGLIQALLGAYVRAAIERISEAMPLASEAEWIKHLDAPNLLHIGLGFFIFALSLNIGVRIFRECKGISSAAWQAALAVLILSVVQLLLGLEMLFRGVVPLTRVLHLWSAALLIGNLLIVFISVRQARRAQHA